MNFSAVRLVINTWIAKFTEVILCKWSWAVLFGEDFFEFSIGNSIFDVVDSNFIDVAGRHNKTWNGAREGAELGTNLVEFGLLFFFVVLFFFVLDGIFWQICFDNFGKLRRKLSLNFGIVNIFGDIFLSDADGFFDFFVASLL